MSNPVNPVTETDLKTNCDTDLEIIGTLDYARRSWSDFSHDDDRGVSVVGGGSLSFSLSLPLSLSLSLCLPFVFACIFGFYFVSDDDVCVVSVVSGGGAVSSVCHYQSGTNCSTTDPVLKCGKFGI